MSANLRVTGHAIGASSRNGASEGGGYVYGRSPRTAMPARHEAALRRLIEDRNARLRQRRADLLVLAWHRDVPRSCTCDHQYYGAAFIVTRPDPVCPWHTRRQP